MSAPRILDLFCCEGGAGVGYARAGFEVVGVDLDADRAFAYPFDFKHGDALGYAIEHHAEFDAIHASPPCQASTTMSNRWRGKGGKADEWENLIPATRELLDDVGLPYVIENVPGARGDMDGAVTLHGGMFGLGVNRPRLFVTNWPLVVTKAARVKNPVGVYGKAPDGRRLFTRADGSEQRAASSNAQAAHALGVDWDMTWTGLRECIPPAYTEHIGRQLMTQIVEVAA